MNFIVDAVEAHSGTKSPFGSVKVWAQLRLRYPVGADVFYHGNVDVTGALHSVRTETRTLKGEWIRKLNTKIRFCDFISLPLYLSSCFFLCLAGLFHFFTSVSSV